MPAISSPKANQIAVQALRATGKSYREIAAELGCDAKTAWRYRHAELLDQELISHAARTVADKLLLASTAATDALLEKAQNGELENCHPTQLAKIASEGLKASGAYAALSGAKDTFAALAGEYGLESSGSASRVTVTQQVTVERTAVSHRESPQPIENTHIIEARPTQDLGSQE